MKLLSAFRQALEESSDCSIVQLVRKSLQKLEENKLVELISVKCIKREKTRKQAEIELLYAGLAVYEHKLKKILTKTTRLSSVTEEKLQKNVAHYQKRLDTLIEHVHLAEEELLNIFNLIADKELRLCD